MGREILLEEDNIALLQAENLGRFFGGPNGGRWGLRGVSFTLQAGATLGVVGPNGSGKSTLLKLLAGSISPSEGYAVGCGRIVSMQALNLGFVAENTISESIAAQAAFWGVPRHEALAIVEEALAWCELDVKPNEKIYTLSSGMGDRIAFAASMFLRPNLLLADGGVGVGDAVFHERCLDRIEQLVSDGMGLILATHRQKLIDRFCREVLLLRDGIVEKFYLIAPGESLPISTILAEGYDIEGGDASSSIDSEAATTSAIIAQSPKYGVVSVEIWPLVTNDGGHVNRTAPPKFAITVDVPSNVPLRIKADFYLKRDLVFRVVSPEWRNVNDREHLLLSLPEDLLMPGTWRIEVAVTTFVGKSAMSKFKISNGSRERFKPSDLFGQLTNFVEPSAVWEIIRATKKWRGESGFLVRNEICAILKVRLLADEAQQHVRAECPWSVEIDFLLSRGNAAVRLFAHFSCDGQHSFLTCMDQPQVLQPGRWLVRVSFPTNILAERKYSLSIAAVFPDNSSDAPLILSNALMFDVDSDLDRGPRAGWTGEMPGVVMPQATWARSDTRP